MSKIDLVFKKIYLVSVGEGQGGTHRITKRAEGPNSPRPKTVRFWGTQLDKKGNIMGTLVLDEELWQQWLGEDTPLEGYETAQSGAKMLVARNPHVLYGCPLCAFTCGTEAKSKEHVETHGQKVLELFDVRVRRNKKDGNKSTKI